MDDILKLVMESYGLLGVFLLLPTVMCVFLWKKNEALTKQMQANHKDAADRIQECNDRIVEAHKTRVSDAQAINNRLVEMVGEQSALNKETILALDKLGDRISERYCAGHGARR